MTQERESRPVRSRTATDLGGNQIAKSILPPNARNLANRDAWDEVAEHVDGTFVVVVKVSAGKYRRRCYLTAKAAQAAADRAVVRGESAVVYLAELRPVWRLDGGGR